MHGFTTHSWEDARGVTGSPEEHGPQANPGQSRSSEHGIGASLSGSGMGGLHEVDAIAMARTGRQRKRGKTDKRRRRRLGTRSYPLSPSVRL